MEIADSHYEEVHDKKWLLNYNIKISNVWINNHVKLFLSKVTKIWSDHLKHLVELRTKAPDAPKGFGPLAEDNDDEEGLGE